MNNLSAAISAYEWTPRERQAIFYVLEDMMMVDDKIDEREKSKLAEFASVLGVRGLDAALSRRLTVEGTTSIINSMPETKRALVAKMITAVAHADGIVHPMEDSFARYLSEKLNLKPEWF